MIKKISKFLIVFLIILGTSFSNVPFYVLTEVIDSYKKNSDIVDRMWFIEQNRDSDVVDNFVSFYRNKNIALLNTLAGNLKTKEAHAATSYVGGVTCSRAGSTGTNLTCSLTALTGGSASSPSQDDIVIAVVSAGSAADRAIGVTNAGYTELPELYSNGSTYDTNLSVSWKIMGTTPDSSVTFGPSGNAADAISGVVHVWRGVDTGTPFDVTSQSVTGTGTGRPDPPAITPTTSGATVIVIGAGAAGAGANYTASGLSNFRTVTSVDTNDSMTGMGSYAWSSGAYDPAQFTGGTTMAGDSWAAYTLALRPILDTSAPTPDPMTFATPPANDSAAQISMTATTASDPSTPVNYLFTNDNTSCTSGHAGTGGTSSSWQSGTSYSDSGLQPNKCYGYTVQARDSLSNTGTAPGISSTYTSANTPGTPTLDGATTSTLNLTNAENSNPSSNPTTTFAVQVVTTSPSDTTWLNQWVDGSGNPSASEVWLTDAQLDALVLQGLQTSTTYGVKVKAKNADAEETSLSAEGQGTTSAPSLAVAISQTAGSKVSTKNSGAVNQYGHNTACTGASSCSAFTLAASGGTINVSSIKITESGTATANTQLSDINLYYDTDGNWADAGAETLFGTTANFAGDQTATVTGTLAISSGATTYIYVRYDLANGSTYPMGGATVNFAIASASDVVSDGTESGTGSLAGTQTILPTADSVSYVVGSDGGRSGSTATISGKGFGAPSADADQEDCSTATVGSKGCVRFVVGGNDTVLGSDISAWSNTSITFTINSALASDGGVSALEVVSAGQTTATDLTYYIYPTITTITNCDADGFPSGAYAKEYSAGDSACPNTLTDGAVIVNGDHFGSAGTVTIHTQTATQSAVAAFCGGSAYTSTCIALQVPTAIADDSYSDNLVINRTSANAKSDTLSAFRILPRITGFSPTSGAVGDAITIEGNHFCQSETCPTGSVGEDSDLVSAPAFTANDRVIFTSSVVASYWNTGGWEDTGANTVNTKIPTGATTGIVVLKSDGYYATSSSFTVQVPTPTDPTTLIQARNVILTDEIALGAIASSTPVYFGAETSSGITGGTMYLQVEMRPTIGQSTFTNTCTSNPYCFESAGDSYAGGTATLSVATTSADELYHWQTRIRYNKSSVDYYSNWQSYPDPTPNSEGATDLEVDVTAPIISNTDNTPTTNTATLTWDTDELATTQIEYGTDSGLAGSSFTTRIGTLATAHSVTIENLNCDTTYYWRAYSRDSGSVEGTSSIVSFITSSCPSQPAKTTVFHIAGGGTTVTNGAPLNETFLVPMPETATSTKSAFVEIQGIYTSGASSKDIAVQVNSETERVYVVPASSTSAFKILYKVVSVEPSNTLLVTPQTNTTIYITSAKIIVTYAYTP